MEEKLLLFCKGENVLESFSGIFCIPAVLMYCTMKNWKLLDTLEFEGFVYIETE